MKANHETLSKETENLVHSLGDAVYVEEVVVDEVPEDNFVKVKGSRNYNFRRKQAWKAKKRNMMLVNELGHWPHKPMAKENKSGKITHFSSNARSTSLGFHKRVSNKKVRRMPLGTMSNDGGFKKVYPLWYEWF